MIFSSVAMQQQSLARFIPRAIGLNPSVLGPNVTEITLDLHRYPAIRHGTAPPEHYITQRVTAEIIEDAVSLIGDRFDAHNRAGIPDTLHRVSAIRNTCGTIVGLTYRIANVGVQVPDELSRVLRVDDSILIVGPPSSGKTTTLRSISRTLSDTYRKRVSVCKTFT